MDYKLWKPTERDVIVIQLYLDSFKAISGILMLYVIMQITKI